MTQTTPQPQNSKEDYVLIVEGKERNGMSTMAYTCANLIIASEKLKAQQKGA